MSSTPGDIVLITLPEASADGPKLRPALVVASLPGSFQSLLVCGISTQALDNLVPDWDVLLDHSDAEFPPTGLRRASAVRPSFLHAAYDFEVAVRHWDDIRSQARDYPRKAWRVVEVAALTGS